MLDPPTEQFSAVLVDDVLVDEILVEENPVDEISAEEIVLEATAAEVILLEEEPVPDVPEVEAPEEAGHPVNHGDAVSEAAHASYDSGREHGQAVALGAVLGGGGHRVFLLGRWCTNRCRSEYDRSVVANLTR